MSINGKTIGAHCYVLEKSKGKRPTGYDACHSCGNRSCIHPGHLRWASRAENLADKIKDGTACRGEKSWQSKLTEQDVRAIRTDGRPVAAIARDYAVSYATIKAILTGENWGWLK